MIVGPYINGSVIVAGSLVGAYLGKSLPERLRVSLPLTFGIASMGLGIALIMRVHSVPVMVLSLLLGSLVGELLYIERGIGKLGMRARGVVESIVPSKGELPHNEFLEKFVAVLVLFCASGTGIFGSMTEGMTGDHSILLAKSFLDLFTSAIFATSLGYAVATVAVPQLAIQLCLAFGATLIMPLTTPQMIADFSAVGGLIMLATGFRIAGIKVFPVANMLPALVIAMPLSSTWARLF
jgi:uncharacterized protein